jgi:hypothetical protein
VRSAGARWFTTSTLKCPTAVQVISSLLIGHCCAVAGAGFDDLVGGLGQYVEAGSSLKVSTHVRISVFSAQVEGVAGECLKSH